MEPKPHPVDLFTKVAPRYEFLNGLMTVGRDRIWRRALLQAVGAAQTLEPKVLLDLASGTGDVPRMMRDRWPQSEIIATDPNEAMLDQARGRDIVLTKRAPSLKKISWQIGRAESIDRADSSVDAVTIAFGFRNVPSEAHQTVLQEVFRVLRPGGVFAILELGLPLKGVGRSCYSFLLQRAMPPVAGLLSTKNAYEYLAQSIVQFPEPKLVKQMFVQEGYIPFAPRALHGGVCWLFLGRKPGEFETVGIRNLTDMEMQ